MIIQKLTKHELSWPTFASNDEECVNCKQGPGSSGCWKVGTVYKATLPTEVGVGIMVCHTNKFEDYLSSKYLDVSRK